MTTPATTPADGELLCCPFCGGDPGMVQQTKVNWSVMCHVCGAEGGWSNPSDAIALWNKRATPSPGKAQAEREGWQAFWQMAADIESVTDRDGEMFMKGWHAAIQQDKQ